MSTISVLNLKKICISVIHLNFGIDMVKNLQNTENNLGFIECSALSHSKVYSENYMYSSKSERILASMDQ